MQRITDTEKCKPGHLYACFTHEIDVNTGEEYDIDGALVWYGADGQLYGYAGFLGDPEEMEIPVYPYFDYLIEQAQGFHKDLAER